MNLQVGPLLQGFLDTDPTQTLWGSSCAACGRSCGDVVRMQGETIVVGSWGLGKRVIEIVQHVQVSSCRLQVYLSTLTQLETLNPTHSF